MTRPTPGRAARGLARRPWVPRAAGRTPLTRCGSGHGRPRSTELFMNLKTRATFTLSTGLLPSAYANW